MILTKEQEASYASVIDDVLANSDLSTVSTKRVRTGLEEILGQNLGEPRELKEAIGNLIASRFNGVAANNPVPEPPSPEKKWPAAGTNMDDLIGELQVYNPPLSPSVYSPVYPENPHPVIAEIARLMTELYELFVKTRYINAEDLAYPPHTTKPVDINMAARLGLTKDVRPRRISFGGEFGPDMRGDASEDTERWFRSFVDPFYALDYARPGAQWRQAVRGYDAKDGLFMRPWYIALNDCGNHGSVMILDTKDFKMWFIEQLGGTADPYFGQHHSSQDSDSGGTNDTESDNASDDEDDHHSEQENHESAGEGDYDSKSGRSDNREDDHDSDVKDLPETVNENDLDQYPSRPAVELLRDMINRFKTLQYIPGGLYGKGWPEYEPYKQAYIENGWPDDFNGDAFSRRRDAYEEGERDRYRAEEPLRALQALKKWAAMRKEREQTLKEAQAELDALPADADAEQRRKLEKKISDTRYHVTTQEKFEERKEKMRAQVAQQREELQKLLEENPDKDWETLDHSVDPAAHQKYWLERGIEVVEKLIEDESEPAREERELTEAQAKADQVDPAIRAAWEEENKGSFDDL
ncbi:hypothetical protein H2203_000605 [Taxawa tesnikishii (nom. ined.)]|nr:hypothetical protein H2203_000605 [Dothideales sp. JES 119]